MKKIRTKSRIRVPSIFKQAESLHILKKEVARVAILFITAICILTIAQTGKMPLRGELLEGDVSISDIYAPFDYTYTWGMDKEKTEAIQKQAVSEVKDVYVMNSRLAKDSQTQINVFFDNIAMVQNSEMPINRKTYRELRSMFNIKLSMKSLDKIVLYEDIKLLCEISISVLNDVLSRPIISELDKKKLADKKIKAITIKRVRTQQSEDVASLLLPELAEKALLPSINKRIGDPEFIRKPILELLKTQIAPNLTYSEKETETARKRAMQSIEPFYISHDVKKDEIIIFKGERATDKTIAKLSAIKFSTEEKNTFPFISSFAILLLLLFFIYFIYITLFEKGMLKDNTAITLTGILLVVIAALTKVIIYSPLPSYFIPTAAVSMLFTLLIGNTAVFPIIIITSVIVSVMTGVESNIFILSLVGSSVGAFAVKKARTRAHLIKSGIYVGLSSFICIAALGILNGFQPAVFLKEGLWGIGAGIFAAGIAMVSLPLLERVLHLTSDIGLLEMSDLNHPLLKEMANKAPGTYHHSLVVGNLAETGCGAISANPLLARVGAYYHDIGKIAKAEYFSENQPKVSTSHDNLTPHMSSLIITNHVKDGVDLSKKYRLPKPIISMIEQHHGTGLIYYFYQKALEREHEDDLVKEEGFRYPGPKPQSKETAIVFLADSVEAASRALTDPTPARLEELVRRIINNKFIDRQLDECELTLHEIDVIAKSFVHILVGIYHVRVEYPNNGNKPERKKDKSS